MSLIFVFFVNDELTKFKMEPMTGKDECGMRMEEQIPKEDLVWWHVFCLKLDDGNTFLFVLGFFALRRPLTAVAPPVAEHRLWTRRPSGHGPRAQLLRGMWDLPGPGHEPVSPTSAGGLSTTAPPGKPS